MRTPPRLRALTTVAADGVRRHFFVPDEAPPEVRADEPPAAARPDRGGRAVRPDGSWFSAGLRLALGALLGWFLVRQLLRLEQLLALVVLAAFIAVGLEPLVGGLVRLRLRRGWAVAAVLAVFCAVTAGFLVLVIPPVGRQAAVLADAVPGWLRQLHDHQSVLGRVEDHYHLVDRARHAVGGGGTDLVGGVVGAGRLVLDTVASLVVVVTLTLYFMTGLPGIKEFCYRFVPRSRRGRAREITEEVLARTGRYMLGNLLTSAVAGLATFAWCVAVSVPYAAVLGMFVALMDLVPMVGSTVAGVVVSLVALAVSWPVALATAAFYIGFRMLEDYLIMPRTMKYTVDVNPLVTVLAVLVGGVLMGIIGALVAVPAAVALEMALKECVFPRLENS
ncbi:AI-2E family transporter [Kitasatospora sp. NPDC093679]|uniref:AI-2E family transporter n=1 Tax=Kitasatospora sp. NPDC093679 TaxID=3154983 RepID=UPI00342D6C88